MLLHLQSFNTYYQPKKMNKKRLLLIAIPILLIATPFITFMSMFVSETSKMIPAETGEAAPGVFAIKDSFANLYLLEFDGQYIAVDAGNDEETVKNEMNQLGINPEDVKAVLLTHSDSDHIAALGLFAAATVYLPSEEVQMVDGSTSRFFVFKNSLEQSYQTLKDKQIIQFGDLTVKCIATPGHTPGAMSFLVNDKYLFVGDSLSLLNGKVGQFNELFNMDTPTQMKSLKKIAQLTTPTHIFSAHYGMTDQFAAAIADFR